MTEKTAEEVINKLKLDQERHLNGIRVAMEKCSEVVSRHLKATQSATEKALAELDKMSEDLHSK